MGSAASYGTRVASASWQQGNRPMFDAMFDNSTLPMLEQVVTFTQARHGVLAGNIANLDTPGYRSRDLSLDAFQQRLKEAIDEQREAAKRSAYQAPNAAYEPAPEARSVRRDFGKVTDSLAGMLRHDDNNTSMEQQVTEIAKNHAQHNLALSLMTAQFRLLRAAITERA
jgi:flagellar basal-body rod protein FlgB